MTLATAPGLYFKALPPVPEPDPLRTDVAGFAGHTRRGPVGEAVRVEGWQHYLRVFGGLTNEADTPYAIRGYFENGGQVAYVVRLFRETADASDFAHTTWQVGSLDAITNRWDADSPAGGGFRSAQFNIIAATPGNWANRMRAVIRYRYRGMDGEPELEITIRPINEPAEFLSGLRPATLAEDVAARSVLIRLQAVGPRPAGSPPGSHPGPLSAKWTHELSGAKTRALRSADYLAAVELLGSEPEVAITALPDLYRDVSENGARLRLLHAAAQHADERHDRLVLADIPTEHRGVNAATTWLRHLRDDFSDAVLRNVAVYFPQVRVPDPLGGLRSPLRQISPSGHVAGVISRLDRERGAHHTPANAQLSEAVDVSERLEEAEQGVLAAVGVNPIRCVPGRGLQVWGGRTAIHPQSDPSDRFISYRRLIHRLVRTIRRVAEPLVFDTNGPELWLSFVRSITTVLLEAYRSGALKGARPEEAFEVRCDETNNPPQERDQGRVLCDIRVAPVAPMEFITLRVALSADGRMEVIES